MVRWQLLVRRLSVGGGGWCRVQLCGTLAPALWTQQGLLAMAADCTLPGAGTLGLASEGLLQSRERYFQCLLAGEIISWIVSKQKRIFSNLVKYRMPGHTLTGSITKCPSWLLGLRVLLCKPIEANFTWAACVLPAGTLVLQTGMTGESVQHPWKTWWMNKCAEWVWAPAVSDRYKQSCLCLGQLL